MPDAGGYNSRIRFALEALTRGAQPLRSAVEGDDTVVTATMLSVGDCLTVSRVCPPGSSDCESVMRAEPPAVVTHSLNNERGGTCVSFNSSN